MDYYNRIVEDPIYGYGRVIVVNEEYGFFIRNLVYYYIPNHNLHDGGSFHICEDYHGRWYRTKEIEEMLVDTPLRKLIERRQHGFKK